MKFLGVNFANPQYLVWGFAIVLLLVAIVRTDYWRCEVLGRLGFQSGTAFEKPRFRPLKNLLYLLGCFFVWLSLLGPQWGQKETSLKMSGLDLCLGIDVSRSMMAEDMIPSRLQAIKNQLPLFFQELGGDRVAIVPFAGSAYIASPLTSDYSALTSIVDPLDPDYISDQSTNLASGVDACLSALGLEKIHSRDEILSESSKLILLITDGGSTADEESLPVERAVKLGIPISIMAAGTAQGAMIPLRDAYGFRYVQDPQSGKNVISKLEEKSLKEIAQKSKGELFFSSVGQGAWISFKSYLDKFQRESMEAGAQKNLEDRFQIPLFIGIMLLMTEFILAETRLLIFFFLLLSPSLGSTSGYDEIQNYLHTRRGIKAFEGKSFDESVKHFGKTLETGADRWRPRYNWATGKLWLSLPKEGQKEMPRDPPRSLLEAENEISALLKESPEDALESRKVLHYQMAWIQWLRQNRLQALENFYTALNTKSLEALDPEIKNNITLLLVESAQSGSGGGDGESKEGEDGKDQNQKFQQGQGEEPEFKGADVDENQAKKILQSVGNKERETQKKQSRGEAKERSSNRKGNERGQSSGKDPQW